MKKKNWISYGVIILIIPVIVILGAVIFRNKQFAFISMAVTILACVPFFISFENKSHNSTRLVMIAILTALSVVGRLVFAVVPGIKPVTAMVIITALYFGSEAGFMTGSLTALLSNFALGQGPWTPFQMLTWGLIGFVAGLLSERLKTNKAMLYIYGALSGIVFSLLMDLWSVIWQDGIFNLLRYISLLASSTIFCVIYAISNVVFLFILTKPIGSKIERIKEKYGI